MPQFASLQVRHIYQEALLIALCTIPLKLYAKFPQLRESGQEASETLACRSISFNVNVEVP